MSERDRAKEREREAEERGEKERKRGRGREWGEREKEERAREVRECEEAKRDSEIERDRQADKQTGRQTGKQKQFFFIFTSGQPHTEPQDKSRIHSNSIPYQVISQATIKTQSTKQGR